MSVQATFLTGHGSRGGYSLECLGVPGRRFSASSFASCKNKSFRGAKSDYVPWRRSHASSPFAPRKVPEKEQIAFAERKATMLNHARDRSLCGAQAVFVRTPPTKKFMTIEQASR
jgi:hypothetical protein